LSCECWFDEDGPEPLGVDANVADGMSGN